MMRSYAERLKAEFRICVLGHESCVAGCQHYTTSYWRLTTAPEVGMRGAELRQTLSSIPSLILEAARNDKDTKGEDDN